MTKKQNVFQTNYHIVEFNKVPWKRNLLISTITEGLVRYEWSAARYSQVIPVNWGATGFDLNYAALGYNIDDGYNLVTEKAIELDTDWLIIIEDDVIIPPDTFIKFGQYMEAGDEPVVSGLYYTKSEPAEPLLFRGRGNGAFHGWKLGQKVKVDGLPMGCLLINCSILRAMSKRVEEYLVHDGFGNQRLIPRVFETPRRIGHDPQQGNFRQEGTQDLYFFDRVVEWDILKECGFEKAARRKYPFLCDTTIFCRHIDRSTGRQFPS